MPFKEKSAAVSNTTSSTVASLTGGSGSKSAEPSPRRDSKEMLGGCCVCSDESGWDENPLVYCDGQGCNVAVHQACYGIVSVPTGPWYCKKCESQERAARVRCELCPSKEGALKRTDSNSWAHVVCALYIPEVRFGNVSTMEPIVLGLIPQDRFLKSCYICETHGRASKAATGACMQCNKSGCKQSFHVTCAQSLGLLCEEAGNYTDNVKYCGYCERHFKKLNKNIKTIPPYNPVKSGARDSTSPESSPDKIHRDSSKSLKLVPQAALNRDGKDSARLKKGRKAFISSETKSEIKIEAAKFVPESAGSRKASSSPSNGDESEESSKRSDSDSPVKDSSDKPPVVLKFGKQDNGTYYKKDISPAVPSNSSSGRSSPSSSSLKSSSWRKEHKGHLQRSSSKDSSSKRKADSEEELSSERKISKDEGFGDSLPKKSPDNARASPNLKELDSRRTPEKVSEADLAKSAIRATCSVTLDKTQIDRRLLSSSFSNTFTQSANGNDASTPDAVSSATTAEDSASTNTGSVKVTPISNEHDNTTKTKAERDLSQNELKGVTITSTEVPTIPETEIKKEDTSSNLSSEPIPASSSVENEDQISLARDDYLSASSSGKLPRISASGKRIGRPPKKGTHIATSSMAQIRAGLASPPGDSSDPVKRKRKSPLKKPVNGSGSDSAHWMLGASLNPNSSMAKEMFVALEDEIKTHSPYDSSNDKHYLGVPFLSRRKRSPSSQPQNASEILSGGKSQPQTLEELLERQWEQGSQFLMEQASHFDIASLLSSLHQLKEENVELEESVDKLVKRRDHLLAVKARLQALSSLSINTNPQASQGSENRSHQQGIVSNGPSQASRGSAHVSPRNTNSSAIVSPVQHSRMNMISPRGSGSGQQQGPPPPPHHHQAMLPSPRDHRTSSGPQAPPASHIPHRGHPNIENGVDFHHQQQMAAHQRRAADMMSSGHLLTVVSTAAGGSNVHPGSSSRSMPPPPRQSSYPPTHPHPAPRGMPSMSSSHSHLRDPHGPPPPPPHHMPSHHYGPPPHHPPPPGHHYQMVSPPPSHSSMVTLDRSSQQHLRNPPGAPSPHMRMDKR